MTKEYYCNNIIDSKECGETEPEKFTLGRYTKCRKCRNEAVRKHYQKTKEEYNKKNEEKNPTVEILEAQINEIQKQLELLKSK